MRIADQVPEPDPSWSSTAPDQAASPAPWRLYNIGHGQRATVNELIDLLERHLGVTALRDRAPEQLGDLDVTHSRHRSPRARDRLRPQGRSLGRHRPLRALAQGVLRRHGVSPP